jgi:hypothetical protein
MPIDLPVNQKTVYFSLAMQMYMNETIKKPVLKAFQVLFSDEYSNVQKLKALRVLWKAFKSLRGLPEPTKENTWHPNTHRLIELRDFLFERLKLCPARMGLIKRVMDFVIILYDFDPPWRYIFDSLKDEALKMEWQPRGFCDTWKDTYKWFNE